MKQILMTLILVGVMSPAGLYAQKVYKNANNRLVLDLTVSAGMPKDAITTTGKTWIGTPSNTTGPLENNTEKGTINATVYQKLEVAPHDMNSAGLFSKTGTFTMDWVTAFNGCKSSTHGGGNWRLPTQRELMLIQIFRPALESILKDSAINGTAFSNANYWTATEANGTMNYSVNFTYGNTAGNSKMNTNRVRCVREIVD